MCKILSRIKLIADNEGVSIAVIERTIGASRGVISKAVTKGTDIQSKWLELICENYPQYSPEWLITGRGEMLKPEAKHTPAQVTEEKPAEKRPRNITGAMAPFLISEPPSVLSKDVPGAIPLVSERAIGGLVNDENLSIAEKDVKGYYVIPKFRHNNVNFLIEVFGDSMIPTIFPGDIVGCSILYDPQYIQWGKIYLLATRQDGLIVKRLRKSTKPGCFSAVSDNPTLDPFDIPKGEIVGMARVVGVVHLE